MALGRDLEIPRPLADTDLCARVPGANRPSRSVVKSLASAPSASCTRRGAAPDHTGVCASGDLRVPPPG